MSGLGGQGGAEQARAGDGVQRPLRFRFPPRLTRSVGLLTVRRKKANDQSNGDRRVCHCCG